MKGKQINPALQGKIIEQRLRRNNKLINLSYLYVVNGTDNKFNNSFKFTVNGDNNSLINSEKITVNGSGNIINGATNLVIIGNNNVIQEGVDGVIVIGDNKVVTKSGIITEDLQTTNIITREIGLVDSDGKVNRTIDLDNIDYVTPTFYETVDLPTPSVNEYPIVFDTTDNKHKAWDGKQWNNLYK